MISLPFILSFALTGHALTIEVEHGHRQADVIANIKSALESDHRFWNERTQTLRVYDLPEPIVFQLPTHGRILAREELRRIVEKIRAGERTADAPERVDFDGVDVVIEGAPTDAELHAARAGEAEAFASSADLRVRTLTPRRRGCGCDDFF